MNDSKDLLVVGVGTMGRPYLEAAARLGVRVRAVESAATWDHRPQALAEAFHRAPAGPEELWNLAVNRAVAEHVPGGVVAFAEPQVLSAALAQDRLALPGPSLHAAVISRNKALQRTTFADHGVQQPEFRLVASVADARAWMLQRLPVVVKPLTRAGSEGVELVADEAAVDDAGAPARAPSWWKRG
ncbi:hypothetical protein [Streptomyces sp. NRRL F-5126]|uniref:hypothetical protein n=1 Tax=Streptomyces sp. NRRL F-5126 TaxID=1463857 RepID=UPI000A673BE9|nr:hypothetical protein [Streptomyces sp. NRRL F-5126]